MKFDIPNTNVCISATLKDGGAFAGVPVTSLNCYGTNHRYPRVTSTISVDTHFRNRSFVRFCCIFGDDTYSSQINIDSPISENSFNSPPSIVTNCCLVFDTSVQSTITLSTSGKIGTQFVNWTNNCGCILSTTPSSTVLSLTAPEVACSQWIQAVWEEAQGSAS
jgi:hypothetical protein